MAIRSKATVEEESSPFFQKNQKLCEVWEEMLIARGGECSATVTASALHLIGKASNNISVEIRKATYSNGNFLIPSDRNIFKQTLFTIEGVEGLGESFTIKKRHWLDFFKGPSQKKAIDPDYNLYPHRDIHGLDEFLGLLSELILDNSLEIVSFDSSDHRLTIDIRQFINSPEIIDGFLAYFSYPTGHI